MNRRLPGFTIIELLVSMAVLTILMVLFTQVVNEVFNTTVSAEKHIDISSESRVAFDRIGADMDGLLTTPSSTLVAVKNLPGSSSDALVFVTQGRTQKRAGIDENNIRLGIRAFRIQDFADPALDGSEVPMLSWGDGTITWNPPTGASQAGSDVKMALQSAIGDVLMPSVTAGNMLKFQPLADNIIRFKVSFLLSDGTIAALPPLSKDFADLAQGSTVYPVALTAEDSQDGRYVKALVVGVVGLDTNTRRQVTNLDTLANAFPNPTGEQTPLQVWDMDSDSTASQSLRSTLDSQFPATVLKAVRVYQRFYYVN